MSGFVFKKLLPVAAVLVAAWLGIKYLLPVALPFLLGGGVALLAEPVVGRISARVNRGVGTAAGITLTLGVLGAAVVLVGAVAVRQVGKLAGNVPQLADTARQGLTAVQQWLLHLSDQAPEQLQPLLTRTVSEFLSDGTVFIEQMTQRIPGAVTTVIGTVGNGVMGLGTGVLSAYLISGRLPKLRQMLSRMEWVQKIQPAAKRVRRALWGWLKAQLKLSLVTYGIVATGFLFLRIKGGLLWAGAVALVDAVPILGTGTVLLPWALVSLLQGEKLRAIGLLCTYGAAFMTRTVLEPRLVGDQLGLDPLMTLGALYLGYSFWGFPGLILTPILASAAKALLPPSLPRENH